MTLRLVGAALGLLLAISSPKSLAANSCHRVFLKYHFEPKEGDPVSLRNEANSAIEVRFLGRGLVGGHVFRVIPKHPYQNSYILKIYGQELTRDNDAVAFEMVRKAAGSVQGFRVAEVHKTEGVDRMLLEDVRGITLKEFLEDPKHSEEIKVRLKTRFDEALLRIEQGLRTPDAENLYIDDRGLHGLIKYYGLRRNRVSIYIKSDNVIVDAQTLELVVVDPW